MAGVGTVALRASGLELSTPRDLFRPIPRIGVALAHCPAHTRYPDKRIIDISAGDDRARCHRIARRISHGAPTATEPCPPYSVSS